jgi:formylglycine-generating enzyme required for sulfatase activity
MGMDRGWHKNYQWAPADGSAACSESGRRVVRGGSLGYDPLYLRSAYRFGRNAGSRVNVIGFRLARTLAPEATAPSVVSEEERAWAAAKDSNSVAVPEDFITRYGDPAYTGLARARIDELKQQKLAMATPPTTPSARCDGVVTHVGSERRCLKPKDTLRDCPDCPEMVVVPAGHFTMGSPESEPDRKPWEGPQHEVMIGKAFAVGRFAVTRGEFATFVSQAKRETGGGCASWTGSRWEHGSDKSWRSPGFAQDDRHPVVCVNWVDAKAYAAWLSKKTGESYAADETSLDVRMPPATATTPLTALAEADALHGALVRRADALAGCKEGSAEADELRNIVTRWRPMRPDAGRWARIQPCRTPKG